MPKPLRIVAIAYVTYLAIALLLITPALNLVPHWYLQDNYGRQLKTDWVLLNPFTVSLEIRGLTLDEKTGEDFLGIGEVSVNLSMESIWSQGWVLDLLRVGQLSVNVIRISEDTFNFSDFLAGDPDTEPVEQESSAIPGVTIHDLDIQSESIVFTDNTREKPFSSPWRDLQIRVMDLSTVLEDGRPYSIKVQGQGGGRLHWEGTLSIPKAHSDGHLALDNLSLAAVAEIAEPWLQFELKDGRLAAEADYMVNWSDTVSYQVTSGQFELTVIDIAPKSPEQLPDTGLALSALILDGVSVDSESESVNITSFTIDGLDIETWREGSTISLETLFIGESTKEPTTTAASPPEEENEEEYTGWSASLNTARIINSSLRWRSEFTDPESLVLKPVEVTVENVTWPLSGETRFSLGLDINDQANISVDGALALAEGNGRINYALDGLPLTWFNPNLPAALKATFSDGQIQIEGDVSLSAFSPVEIALGGQVKNFAARREHVDTTLTGWDTVRLEGLSVNMEENSLVLEKLAIDGYKGRLHIAKDGSVNASNVWKEEVGEQAEEIAEDLTGNKPWSFSIPMVQITDSEIDYMDESLPIPFRTVVGELDGDILGMSTEAGSKAKVAIKGSVDEYAPMVLSGEFNPFATPTALDLDLTFDGVDMARFTPYTGTYAGYAIDRGLLDLHLHYILADDQLKAKNDIRIDQLKLGEKIDSDKAADLPLELALAILTDTNGVIDMKVPVSGDVSDPDFDLGGVISSAFFNIITKAVTAPFTLLAGLVDSEEDLQNLPFPSGSSKLDDATRAKLDQLGAALAQRPGLSLVVTGRLNLEEDRERMQKNILKAQLVDGGLTREELDNKGPAWEAAIGKRYAALSSAQKQTSATTPREQYQVVTSSIALEDTQLIELGEERAVTVKNYLVDSAGMVADRAVLARTTLDAEDNRFGGVALTLGN